MYERKERVKRKKETVLLGSESFLFSALLQQKQMWVESLFRKVDKDICFFA